MSSPRALPTAKPLVGERRRSRLSPREAGEIIGVPVEEWPGRCHEIASLLLAADLISGTLRYGMWVGPIAKESSFAGRTLCHHGWVEREPAIPCPGCRGAFRVEGPCCDLNGGSPAVVVDPTRWVFEHVRPYIFEGHDVEAVYDVAGDRVRQALMRPYPVLPQPWEALDKTPRPDVTLDLGKPHALHLAVIISENGGPTIACEDGGTKLTIANRGLGWVANLPLAVLRGTARPLYEALDKLDQSALVPMDNREVAMGDGFYGKKEKVVERVTKARRERKS